MSDRLIGETIACGRIVLATHRERLSKHKRARESPGARASELRESTRTANCVLFLQQ